MNVVVDTNRIIAALIKNGISRRIIMDNKKFEFLIPDHSLIEVEKYREEIKQKAHISDQEFEVLLSLLLEKIEIIPKAEYEFCIDEARKLIPDIGDVPFLALAIAVDAVGVWSEDAHFQKQNKMRVLKTSDMVEELK